MSIMGYLVRRGPETRLRRGLDSGGAGIRVEGPVLSGEKAVEQRRAEDAAAAKVEGEFYESVKDYDPVLKGHRGS